MEIQAEILYRQRRFEDATSRGLGIVGKLGAAEGVGSCRDLLRKAEGKIRGRSAGFPAVSFWKLHHTSVSTNDSRALTMDLSGYPAPEVGSPPRTSPISLVDLL